MRIHGLMLRHRTRAGGQLAQEGAMGRANETGFTLCRGADGRLMNGPVVSGTPNRVKIPLQCPPDTAFVGLYHTHPGGIAEPSDIDLATARRVGAENMCINADGDLRCYRMRSRRPAGGR